MTNKKENNSWSISRPKRGRNKKINAAAKFIADQIRNKRQQGNNSKP